ncbi:MAG: P1 family peptidase [Candidatus Aminicenantes bacterium]|nr:P1 family peptidase [Candidatus Aminicenantes bacterium]
MKAVVVAGLALVFAAAVSTSADRPRLREFGLKTGVLEPGPLNAITDVAGVRVGHVTLIQGTDVRTGVTAVLPHEGNVFLQKVPGAVEVANGFGKLMGSTQVEELGTVETPIILTNTLSVPTAADAVLDYVLSLPMNESVTSVNPVVGETNDGGLNDIRGRHVKKEHVLEAIRKAAAGPVEEGSVGAGTGTQCYGFKGGIGTSSRKLASDRGGYTVGVLAQTNHGGVLMIAGLPVGEKLRSPAEAPAAASPASDDPAVQGSCMLVVATDAPLDARNLKRLARRALLGIARTGGFNSNGSGDYAIAFSTAKEVRSLHRSSARTETPTLLRNDAASPLFQAAAEAAEEAILNSLFKATRVEGRGGRVSEPLPLDKLKELIK